MTLPSVRSKPEYARGIYHCQRCGWCRVSTYHDKGIERVCPIYEYDTDDNWEVSYSRGHIYLLRALLDGEVEPTPEIAATFFKCTLCGNCSSVCYSNTAYEFGYTPDRIIDHVALFEDARADFVAAGLGPLPQHKTLIDSINAYDNPWYQPRSARRRWTRSVPDVKIKDLNTEKADVLLYVGCTASYDQNMRELAINTAKVLSRAGIDFGILGNAEKCCGSTILRCGMRDDFERLARSNVEQFAKTGARTVVTPCAGCFKTLKQDYPRVADLPIEIVHSTAYFDRLLEEGKVGFKPAGGEAVPITWHDPCHLGRAMGIYDEPRRVLQAIPTVRLVEMIPTREYSICCGAGGGVKTAFPDLAARIAGGKMAKAKIMGVEAMVTACPFCERNLADGASAEGLQLAVRDIASLVVENLE